MNNPPTTVEGVTVTGQRRHETQPFPVMPPAVPVPLFPENSATIGPDTEYEYLEPCDIGAFRDKWNSDAAGASAIDAFLDHSQSIGDSGSLANREFGAAVVRTAGNNVGLGPVTHGDPVQPGHVPSVTIDYTGVNGDNWLGDVHSHPSGDPRPSAGDWAGFQAGLAALRAANLPTHNRYLYIVVYDASTSSYKVYVYGESDDPDQVGQEVNPQAQACPSQ